ncbi:MAG: hypothetical protein F4008_05190 [Gammaproteobacteria bacterium]|nr:hypothetical protein [Gammaproteobacteria bacterium]
MQMPTTDDTPQRNATTLLIALSGHLVLTAAGGWVLYQSAITDMDATVADAVGRLEERIDANGERIGTLGERVERNSVLIAQIGERVDRNAELIARNADLIMQNAERIDRNGELITQLRERTAAVEVRVGALEEVVRFFHPPENQLQQEP